MNPIYQSRLAARWSAYLDKFVHIGLQLGDTVHELGRFRWLGAKQRRSNTDARRNLDALPAFCRAFMIFSVLIARIQAAYTRVLNSNNSPDFLLTMIVITHFKIPHD